MCVRVKEVRDGLSNILGSTNNWVPVGSNVGLATAVHRDGQQETQNRKLLSGVEQQVYNGYSPTS